MYHNIFWKWKNGTVYVFLFLNHAYFLENRSSWIENSVTLLPLFLYLIHLVQFQSKPYSQLILSPSAQIKNMCGETTDSQDLFLFNRIVVFQSSSEGLGTIERLSRAMAGLQLTDSDSEHLAAFIANKYLQSIYFITYKNMTKCKMASSVSWKRKQETRTIPLPSWCHHQIHQCVNSKRMYVSV